LLRPLFCFRVLKLFLRISGLILLLSGTYLFADVGIVLSEPNGQGASRFTSAGHASVYFSRICPESPVRMRLCEPGEEGSVLSNYSSFSENHPYAWNLVPLNVFLYGVEDEQNRPLLATPGVRRALQDQYRAENLEVICSEPSCAANPRAHWRDMVAATFARKLYIFEVRTTVEQDRKLIERFNGMANVDHYNGFTNNCADFAREVINSYFPGVARPDHVNDFGMTSPKAIARSFSHYARHHPELEFRALRFAQAPGEFKRSSECRKGTEVAFRSKKWLLPMLLKSHELALFAASYTLTGRFNPDHEVWRSPNEHLAQYEHELATADPLERQENLLAFQQESQRARTEVLGSDEQWKSYAIAAQTLIDHGIELHLIANRRDLDNVFRELDRKGAVSIDPDGALWMSITDEHGTRRVGLSAGNVNAPGSAPDLAYLILLSRVSRTLKSPAKARESMVQFREDWALLQQTRAQVDAQQQFQIKVASGAQSSDSGSVVRSTFSSDERPH
jgi:hypothetical protein